MYAGRRIRQRCLRVVMDPGLRSDYPEIFGSSNPPFRLLPRVDPSLSPVPSGHCPRGLRVCNEDLRVGDSLPRPEGLGDLRL